MTLDVQALVDDAKSRIREISAAELSALAGGDHVLIDVREPGEFAQGHLPGAVNMDYFGGPFETQIQSLPKTAPVLLYCRTGNRSGSAYDVMTKAGIGNILHMNEGITKWQQLGLPQEK